MPTDHNEIERLVEQLTEAQRSCGDVLDRLPCLHCGATTLRQCQLDMAERFKAGTLINHNVGLHNHLLALRARDALSKDKSDG